MAQLIKLEDYISRYEWDPYKYPSRFIRLKREQWDQLHAQRERDIESATVMQEETISQAEQEESFFKKWFRRKKDNLEAENPEPETERIFGRNLARLSETELKHFFLDHLFPIQLKWATSTVTEVSFVKRSYERDRRLKYFLQRFPDTFLIMYYPIFNIRKAPIECEIIMITPLGIEIIASIEKKPGVRIIAGDERKWTLEDGERSEMILNPAISLKRTEHVVRSILSAEGVEFPIRKTILAEKNQIIYTTEPYQIDIIDELRYPEWFEEKRKLNTPLKSLQLKSVAALLGQTRTNAVKRPEWEEDKPYMNAPDDRDITVKAEQS
ncbi:NERD domain-containing protein [Aciduricibacillus chroicocephali]|uniref:NERD domain-containing protein n=1 Tax=Aciduricibacillus chroicocephali TaxID=3054939 RepID=A0ABY9KSN2_9BACI|nr:NERD domain-containing protein [Bacillaceae bacterium 44XB]